MDGKAERNKRILKRLITYALIAALVFCAIVIGIQLKAFTNSNNSTQNLYSKGYYYSRLSEDEKKAYDAVCNNIHDMPQKLLLPATADIDSVNKVIEAFRADNCFTELLAADKISFVDSFLGNYLTISYTMTQEEYRKLEDELNRKIDSIISNMPRCRNDFEKELYLHDYIVKNTQYEINKKPLSNTAYGALVENKSACVGYAQAMKMLLNKADIQCITVCGEADDGKRSENHMWNQVKLSGQWYNLDPTWDDAVGETPTLTHKFFNLTDSELKKTHTPYVSVNECTASADNYFVEMGLLFDSYDEQCKNKIFEEIARASVSEPAEIRFSSKDEYKRACKKLIEQDIFLGKDKIEAISSKQIDIENTGIIRCDNLCIIEFKVSYK